MCACHAPRRPGGSKRNFASSSPSTAARRLAVEGGMRRPPLERSAKVLRLFASPQKAARELGLNVQRSPGRRRLRRKFHRRTRDADTGWPGRGWRRGARAAREYRDGPARRTRRPAGKADRDGLRRSGVASGPDHGWPTPSRGREPNAVHSRLLLVMGRRALPTSAPACACGSVWLAEVARAPGLTEMPGSSRKTAAPWSRCVRRCGWCGLRRRSRRCAPICSCSESHRGP